MPNLARFDTWIRSAVGPAAAGASVFICSQPCAVSSNPTPKAQLYSDVAGTLPIAQPLVADGFGHVFCYIASGTYTIVVVYGGQLVLSYPDQVIAVGSGSSGTLVSGLPSIITAPAGDVITADGAGNIQDGGVLLSNLASAVSVTNETNRALAAEALLAPKASPVFTGIATVPEVTFPGSGSGSVSIISPAAPSTWTMTLPTTAGVAGQALVTNGSGATLWATPGPVSGQNVWIAAANGFAAANFAQGAFMGNTVGNCLPGRYALCMPAIWKVSFQAFPGNTTKIAACSIVVCPADSPVASSHVIVLFSGIGTASFTSELTSDAISLQIDAEHDYYLMVYYDGTSNDPGYWQNNGLNAAVYNPGAIYSTVNNTNPTNILTTPSSPSTNFYIHYKKITVA